MAQHPRGWTLKPHSGTGVLHVRFRHAGTRHEITTGTRDAARAAEAAANIYAAVIAGRWRRGAVMVAPSTPIDELAAEWLDEAASGLDPETVKTYLGYVRAHWQPHFGSIGQVNPATLWRYVSARLGKVVRRTLQKELSALRGFLGWCAENRGVERFEVPAPPKKATGKADARPHKLRAVELSPEQVEAFLAELPVEAERGNWPIRARFTVAYETGLRPATLDTLRADDFADGMLRIRGADDKARFGRDLPLSPLAASVLKELCRGQRRRGESASKLLFGKHDYRAAFAAACKAAGIPRISPYDLRHAFGTHRVESSGGNLPGVAYLMGHKQITTTAKYAKPNVRAGKDALGGHSGAASVRKERFELSRVISPLEPERSASGHKRSELFSSVSARIAKKRPDSTDSGAVDHLLDALDSAVAGEAEETTASLARAAELLQAGHQ